ncbi:MAG: hypothetical protein HY051_01065 [Candidatus Aenigmarchaeota archaeon]|nr:hypothetical protein [Candidatus Aenigmarchaeota archaeon]
MKTRTITISVEKDTEERFRRLAGSTYGKRKGYLGKAVTEAMKEWEKSRTETDTVVKSVKLLETGISMGKLKFRSREELHDR